MKPSINNILRKIRNNQKVTETNLLLEMSDQITVFEYALKTGKTINCDRLSKSFSLDLILKYKAYYLLKIVDIKSLLKKNNSNKNETYLQTIFRLFKQNKKINISFINPFDNATSLYDTAVVYLLYAKNDLIEYLPYLDSNLLLLTSLDNNKEDFKTRIEKAILTSSKMKTLLEIMLDMDKELTLKKVLNNSIRRNFDVAMILRAHGIEQKTVDYDIQSNDYIKEIIGSINNRYDNIEITLKEKILLQELYNSFIRHSDKEAVEALVNSYKIQLQKKQPNTILEILKLIELSQCENPLYIKIGQSEFIPEENKIEIQMPIVDIVNHEISHALFYNLTDGSVPEEFWQIINRIKSNKNILDKVNDYSQVARENSKKLSDCIEDKYNKDFPLMNKILELEKILKRLGNHFDNDLSRKKLELEVETSQLRKNISNYLLESKSEKMKTYLARGYNEDDLKIMFDNVFTIAEYVKMHKRIQKRECLDAISATLLAPQRAIGDIIDAIHQGKYLSGSLYYDNKKIKPIAGHGIFYYNYDETAIFDEMLANYRVIMMCEDSENCLIALRYYVGNELVDFLDYYNNILLRGCVKGEKYGRR